ncbi:MAG: thioredoxin [Deltaproteobacteria bacterium]|nr:thioredoxin [Deltaproteobacteria bacterium]
MGSNEIAHLDDKTFDDTLQKTQTPILVDFWAEWCMPCRALAPVLDELAGEYSGKVLFAKVNVDECREVPAKYGIRGIPTLILFNTGKKINELVGNQPKEKIRTMLNSAIGAK